MFRDLAIAVVTPPFLNDQFLCVLPVLTLPCMLPSQGLATALLKVLIQEKTLGPRRVLVTLFCCVTWTGH